MPPRTEHMSSYLVRQPTPAEHSEQDVHNHIYATTQYGGIDHVMQSVRDDWVSQFQQDHTIELPTTPPFNSRRAFIRDGLEVHEISGELICSICHEPLKSGLIASTGLFSDEIIYTPPTRTTYTDAPREGIEKCTSGDEMAVKIKVCGHIFGDDCLNRWLRSGRTCPTCRQELFHNPDTLVLPEPVPINHSNDQGYPNRSSEVRNLIRPGGLHSFSSQYEPRSNFLMDAIDNGGSTSTHRERERNICDEDNSEWGHGVPNGTTSLSREYDSDDDLQDDMEDMEGWSSDESGKKDTANRFGIWSNSGGFCCCREEDEEDDKDEEEEDEDEGEADSGNEMEN